MGAADFVSRPSLWVVTDRLGGTSSGPTCHPARKKKKKHSERILLLTFSNESLSILFISSGNSATNHFEGVTDVLDFGRKRDRREGDERGFTS